MELPILIAQRKNYKICPDDYKIGWLMKDNTQGVWMVWGSCKDFRTAINCVKDTIKKKGNREVYLSSIPLESNLTLEELVNLENITESFRGIYE